MRTACFPTVHVVVAANRRKYQDGVSQIPCLEGIHTHPPGIPAPVLPTPLVYLPPGIPTPWTYPSQKGPGTRYTYPFEGTWDRAYTSLCGQTHTCENITFLQLPLQVLIMLNPVS